MEAEGGMWRHIYLEASSAFSGSINVFSDWEGHSKAKGRLLSVSLWNRALTSAEVLDLASGGEGGGNDAL
eukprot:224634-Pleurochrysis_carterae.AAC.1